MRTKGNGDLAMATAEAFQGQSRWAVGGNYMFCLLMEGAKEVGARGESVVRFSWQRWYYQLEGGCVCVLQRRRDGRW